MIFLQFKNDIAIGYLPTADYNNFLIESKLNFPKTQIDYFNNSK